MYFYIMKGRYRIEKRNIFKKYIAHGINTDYGWSFYHFF